MIKKCGWCHGKGERRIITKMTFGEDAQIEHANIKCKMCGGEGKVFIVPASQAPKVDT